MRIAPDRVVAVVLFAALSLVFLRWIPDDAYISFRYALNFAEGEGLVFNPGERVEGYSNFLWTILLSLCHRAGVAIPHAAVALSLGFALGTILLALKLFEGIARDVAGEPTYRSHMMAVSLALVVSLPMVYWATSGLETYAAAFFLLLGAVLYLKAEREDRADIHAGSIAAYFMVAVLRPEGIAYFVINAIVVYARRRRRLPRTVVAAMVVCSILYIEFLLSRTLYYDALVPNTYWAKPSTTLGYYRPLVRGVRYLVRYFVVSGLVLLVPIAVVTFFRAKRLRHTVRYLLGLLLIQFAFIVWVGGDVLRFDRFGVAFHPILLALVLAGAVSWEAARGRRPLLRATIWGAVLATVLLSSARIYRADSKYCIHDWMHAHFHARLGAALGEMLPDDASIAFNEMGALPYYSRLVTYDMLGLTDKTVASIIFASFREYGDTSTDFCRRAIGDYIMDKHPTCIILPSYGEVDVSGFNSSPDQFHTIWYGIYTHPTLQRHYRADFTVGHGNGKFLNVYLRKGLTPDRSPLAAVAQPECVTVITYPR